MEEYRGISSGFASESASDSGFSGEKRNGNGLEEKDEFRSKLVKVQDLDSDDKSDNLQSHRNIGVLKQPNLSSEKLSEILVSPDPEGVVRIMREDINGISKNVSESVGDSSLSLPISKKVGSDSMRKWMEMKRNGFLSAPLGEVAASSSVISSSPVELQKIKRKRTEVPKKEQKQLERFSNVTDPSGLLRELNPGIINHVRSKKQVCSIIEALIGNGDGDVEERHVDLNSQKEKIKD